MRQLKCHPQSIAIAASTISKKGLEISQYQKELDSNMPLRILGSTLDQSSVTRTVLRVSAMLSYTVIPVALFSRPKEPKHTPTRFTDAFAEIRGAFSQLYPNTNVFLIDKQHFKMQADLMMFYNTFLIKTSYRPLLLIHHHRQQLHRPVPLRHRKTRIPQQHRSKLLY